MEFNLLGEYVALIFIFTLILFVRKFRLYSNLKNKLFRFCYYYVFVEIVLSIVSILFIEYYTSISIPLNYLVQTIYFISAPFTMTLFTLFVLATYYEEDEDLLRTYIKLAFIPILLHSIFVATNPLHQLMFEINSTSGYVENSLFFISFATPVIYVGIMVLTINRNRTKFETKLNWSLLSFPVAMLLLFIVQFIVPSFILTGSAATVALLIIYMYVQNKLVILDDLTGLRNRNSFQQTITANCNQKKQYSVVMIRLEDFELINDQFGEAITDAILVNIGHFLQKVSPLHYIFRYGGVVFTAIIEHKQEQDTTKFIQRIERRFSGYWDVNNLHIKVAVAIAVVHTPDQTDTFEGTMELLNYSIDKASTNPNITTVFADNNMVLELERRRIIIRQLNIGLSNDYFEVYFQPIYSIKTKKLSSMEALLRFDTPILGRVSPSEFIPIAETTGHIVDIGYFVIKQSCAFIKRLEGLDIEFDHISINLSVLQFNAKDFVQQTLDIIKQNNVDVTKLCFEITETVFIENADNIKSVMTQFIDAGLQFHLDDFGTGFSNLSSLIELPFKAIKIDKSILYRSINSTTGFIVIEGLCQTFSSIGKTIIIEGVETDQQNVIVSRLQADYIQGFLYARPQSADDTILTLSE